MEALTSDESHPSDQLVDINNIKDVENLHQQFNSFTHEQIKEAIQSVGPLRKDVEDHLKNRD